MKHMNRIFALALALIMVLGLATTAYATEKNDSITINEAVVGETYNIYKLFDLEVNSETAPTAYSYKVNAEWKAFFEGDGVPYITVNDAGCVTEIKAANGDVTEDAKDLAKAAAAWAGKPAATDTEEASSDTVVFEGLDDGYWLITSTLGTNAMIQTTPAAQNVTINEKNPEDKITKEVKEDSTGEYGEENDAQIGDVVEFKSVATLYPATRNVVIHDTMTDGLSFTAGSIEIHTDAALTTELASDHYEILGTPADGDTFTIKIKDSYIATLTAETKLYLTYTATLNENAVKDNAIVPQVNKTQITFGDEQSVEDQTETTTHKFSVHKHAKGSNDNLADAVFSLKKNGAEVNLIKLDDNNYRVAKADEAGAVGTFTTVANGNIVIWGVDSDGDYTLEEITAPDGYNKLATEVDVVWAEEEGKETVIDVENKTGSLLPSTGGIGTTLFYVIGGLLVVAAVVLLIAKKRMASAE